MEKLRKTVNKTLNLKINNSFSNIFLTIYPHKKCKIYTKFSMKN